MEGGIRFGTDGWRSTLDGGFTVENVKRVAYAISEYVAGSPYSSRGVFIGYDGRAGSRKFAEACASILSLKGIQCFLPPRPVPTPFAAFAALRYSLAGSIMITASHNPPEYNGIKFIPHYGGPAMPDVTGKIESLIPDKLPPTPPSPPRPFSELDPFEDYLRHLHGLVRNRLDGIRVVVDSMHGATSGYASRAFEDLGARVEGMRDSIDPSFGGCIPDPTPERLSALRSKVASSGSDLGVAFDGDGDRLASVAPDGAFLMVNQLLPLVYLHLLERRSMRGDAARTVATSHLVDLVARAHGQSVIEVPVGFKYIGSLLREGMAIVGGEESGGMSFSFHMPEKDGIASAAMLMEAIALSHERLDGLYRGMAAKYGAFASRRLDLRAHLPEDFAKRLEAGIRGRGEILGRRVLSVNNMDGVKAILEGGSWILFRKSGTEDLVRVYAESPDAAFTDSLISFGKSLLAVFK